jgi:hypothetical protein
MQGAISCSDVPPRPGECQFDYGVHCPIMGGVPNCNPTAGAHNGYFMVCSTIGGQNCVHCSNGEYCPDAGNLPLCP